MTNQYSNPDEGALETSSESEVQLPDEHALLLSKFERLLDSRFDRHIATIPAAISNGFRGVQGLVDGLSHMLREHEATLGEVLTKTEIAERLRAMDIDKNIIDQVQTQVKTERKMAELEAQQAKAPETKTEEVSEGQLGNYWSARYAQHHEPDILDDAFGEGLISTTNTADLTEAEKALLKRLIPGLPANSWRDVTEDMYLDLKRQARKNFKAEAESKAQVEKKTTALPTARQTAGATGQKFTRSDIANMKPEEFARNKDAIFTQMQRR